MIEIGQDVYVMDKNLPKIGTVVEHRSFLNSDNEINTTYVVRLGYQMHVEYSDKDVFENKTALTKWFKATINAAEQERKSLV